MDVQEVRKLDAYLKRVFGNQKLRVVPRPKKDDSAEVYIGEEVRALLQKKVEAVGRGKRVAIAVQIVAAKLVDDEDDDRSFQFQMAILEEDLVDQG